MMSTKFPKLFPGMKLSRDVAYIEILLSPAANLREPRVRHKTAAVELLGDSPVRPAFGVPPSRGNKNTMGTQDPRQIKGSGPSASQLRPSPARLTSEGGRKYPRWRPRSGPADALFAPAHYITTTQQVIFHRYVPPAGPAWRRAPASSRFAASARGPRSGLAASGHVRPVGGHRWLTVQPEPPRHVRSLSHPHSRPGAYQGLFR